MTFQWRHPPRQLQTARGQVGWARLDTGTCLRLRLTAGKVPNNWLSLITIGAWLTAPQSTGNRHFGILRNMMWYSMALNEHGFVLGPRCRSFKDHYLFGAKHFCLVDHETLVAFHGWLRPLSPVNQAAKAAQIQRYPLSSGQKTKLPDEAGVQMTGLMGLTSAVQHYGTGSAPSPTTSMPLGQWPDHLCRLTPLGAADYNPGKCTRLESRQPDKSTGLGHPPPSGFVLTRLIALPVSPDRYTPPHDTRATPALLQKPVGCMYAKHVVLA